MAAPEYISEYVIQPRTGSLCPEDNQCQDDTHIDNWSNSDFTLGFSNDTSSKCTEDQWQFEVTDKKNRCINPVPKMCSQIYGWDGMNYDPSNWKPSPLDDTVVSSDTKFNEKCVTSRTYEATNRSSYCPLRCIYDPTKFKTLEQVQAYQKKFGKYERKLDNTVLPTISPDTFNDDSTGEVLSDANYTENYNKIMHEFCSQQSTQCRIDPKTNKRATKCSYLKSTGNEGKMCTEWMEGHGKEKYRQMDYIKDRYCTAHPDSYDCRCANRNDDETFSKFQNSIATLNKNPGCYYLPCADSTNYIIGTDIMEYGGSGSGSDVGDDYGVQCGQNLCMNILNIDSNETSIVEGNKLYIQCGKGIKYFGILNNKIYLGLIIAGSILFVIIIVMIIWYFMSDWSGDKQHRVIMKPMLTIKNP